MYILCLSCAELPTSMRKSMVPLNVSERSWDHFFYIYPLFVSQLLSIIFSKSVQKCIVWSCLAKWEAPTGGVAVLELLANHLGLPGGLPQYPIAFSADIPGQSSEVEQVRFQSTLSDGEPSFLQLSGGAPTSPSEEILALHEGEVGASGFKDNCSILRIGAPFTYL